MLIIYIGLIALLATRLEPEPFGNIIYDLLHCNSYPQAFPYSYLYSGTKLKTSENKICDYIYIFSMTKKVKIIKGNEKSSQFCHSCSCVSDVGIILTLYYRAGNSANIYLERNGRNMILRMFLGYFY